LASTELKKLHLGHL